jgi:hypothetical protein
MIKLKKKSQIKKLTKAKKKDQKKKKNEHLICKEKKIKGWNWKKKIKKTILNKKNQKNEN